MTKMEDIIIDTYKPSVLNADISMRLTHVPTGKSVSGTGQSAYKLRTSLFKKLANLLK